VVKSDVRLAVDNSFWGVVEGNFCLEVGLDPCRLVGPVFWRAVKPDS
jgi:hypothetical protein